SFDRVAATAPPAPATARPHPPAPPAQSPINPAKRIEPSNSAPVTDPESTWHRAQAGEQQPDDPRPPLSRSPGEHQDRIDPPVTEALSGIEPAPADPRDKPNPSLAEPTLAADVASAVFRSSDPAPAGDWRLALAGGVDTRLGGVLFLINLL